MNRTELEGHLKELVEHVQLFFAKKNRKEGKKELKRHSLVVLREIPHMNTLLTTNPEYGAIGFLGKIQFSKCPHLQNIESGISEDLFRTFQEKQSFTVAENARKAWDYLVSNNQKSACAILALCYLYESNYQF